MSDMSDFQEREYRQGVLRSSPIAQWAATTAYSLNDRVYPATFTGKVMVCITAGTSGGSEPSFGATLGAETTDNTVTWMTCEIGVLKRPLYIGLIYANKGNWLATTAYVADDYILPDAGNENGRIYKCTSGGTTGASAPTFPTTAGGTVVDGTVTWEEQTAAIEAGTIPEPSVGEYARVAVPPSDSNWTAVSQTDGASTNASDILFAAPTVDWTPSPALLFGHFISDRLTGGNTLFWSAFSAAETVMASEPAPRYLTGGITITHS